MASVVTTGDGAAEVAHEALLREWPRLRSWLEEDRDGRRLHHRVAAAAIDWDASGRDPTELYRGTRLEAALDWSTTHPGEANIHSSGSSSTPPTPRTITSCEPQRRSPDGTG